MGEINKVKKQKEIEKKSKEKKIKKEIERERERVGRKRYRKIKSLTMCFQISGKLTKNDTEIKEEVLQKNT